jgi:hypothetical protein
LKCTIWIDTAFKAFVFVNEMEFLRSHMKMKSKTTCYVVHIVAAALLFLTAQTSRAGSATWLSSPQDSAWENPNNWTAGGPPNGPSDVATFSHSSQTVINISTSVEVNSIVFTSGANSFGLTVSPTVVGGGELIISGTGIIDNSGVLQALTADNTGQIIFKNTSTARDARILGTGGDETGRGPGKIIFNDSSTADSAFLIADGGCYNDSGSITFNGTSTGGTARVQVSFGCSNVSGIGYLNISGHQSGMTIGSIEGDGDVFLGANRLRVGTNNLSTTFRGNIGNDEQGSLTKVGTGILTLQPYSLDLPDTLNLMLVNGSPIKLNTGPSDVIASLKINGVSQPPGIYGGPMSGAPHIVPEFRGTGSVHVFPSTLANISTRAFVQTGDNVMIGGFIIEAAYSEVVIRAIGPELTRYHVPNALANPKLELHDATGALIASNDDWQHTIIGGVITRDQVDDIQDSGHAPANPFESAIIATLQPGNYTAIVRGVNDTRGVGLVEVYDHPRYSFVRDKVLGNVSTRSFVQTGNDVMIGGFVVQGSGAKRVIVRAIGPELSQHGVPNPLADPTLELHNSTGALIARNDNWMTTILGGIITRDQVHDIMDSGHAPTDPSESAIIATLPPGNYTAIVRGVNNTTGVGLVEVYDLD